VSPPSLALDDVWLTESVRCEEEKELESVWIFERECACECECEGGGKEKENPGIGCLVILLPAGKGV